VPVPRYTYPRLSWRVATALNRFSFPIARSTVLRSLYRADPSRPTEHPGSGTATTGPYKDVRPKRETTGAQSDYLPFPGLRTARGTRMGSRRGSGGSRGRGGEWLDLADAIALLREQVVEARARIAGPEQDGGVRFGLGEITVELGMELTRTRGADGGLRFAVAGLGGRRERAEKGTHIVTVRLTPRSSDDGPVDVVDRASR